MIMKGFHRLADLLAMGVAPLLVSSVELLGAKFASLIHMANIANKIGKVNY
jgi:hypothetical protein